MELMHFKMVAPKILPHLFLAYLNSKRKKMTVSSDVNKITYAGNGSTQVFSVNYYFLADSHLQVVLITTAGVETVQTLTTNYTVTGAGNEAGGSITMLVAPPTGVSVVIQRVVPATQETDYLANDPFPAESHERALDKLTMLVQQNERENDRSLKIPLSAVPTTSTELPAPVGNKLLAWNSNASAVINFDPADIITIVGQQTSYGDVFTGNGVTTDFTLTRSPGSVFGIDVSINGVTQVPNVDYTLGGTTLTFTSAPPAAASQILARYAEVYTSYDADAQDVRYLPAGAGAVTTNVQTKLRETVSVKDFGAVGDGVADDTAACQNAFATGKSVYFPNGTYLLTGNLTAQSNTVVDLNGATLSGGGLRITNVNSVTVCNGTFTGTGFGYAIEITNGATLVTLENLKAVETDSGFKFSGEGGSAISYIKTNNLHVSQCKGSAYFHYNANVVMHENISTYNAMWGMNIVSLCDDIKVSNGYFELGASTTTPTGSDAWYTGTPEHGVYANQSNNALFVNCTFKGWNRSSGACGIKWRNFDNIKIIGGLVENCELKTGLFIQSGGIQDYLRRCVVENIVFKNNASTVFVNDYVGSGSGSEEIDVTFRGCTFLADNTTGQVNAQSDNVLSSLVFEDCIYYISADNIGTWFGSREYKNCNFITATTYNLQFFGTGAAVKTTVDGCTFVNWNTSGVVPSSNATQGDSAAIRLDNGASNMLILNCKFMQNSKRRLGAFGTIAGQIQSVVMANCVGGGDIWFFQTGGASNNYLSNNTNYSDTITPNTITVQSAGNNIKLNDDTTVTVY
jgi:hypothetical protein